MQHPLSPGMGYYPVKKKAEVAVAKHGVQSPCGNIFIPHHHARALRLHTSHQESIVLWEAAHSHTDTYKTVPGGNLGGRD